MISHLICLGNINKNNRHLQVLEGVLVLGGVGCFPEILPMAFLDWFLAGALGLTASVPFTVPTAGGCASPLQIPAVVPALVGVPSGADDTGAVPGDGEPGGSPHRLTDESLFSLLAELKPLLLLGRLETGPLVLS